MADPDDTFGDSSRLEGSAEPVEGIGDARDPTKISCLNCRAAKRKCFTPDAFTTCKRCKAQHLDCEYRKHRRGRTKKASEMQSAPAEPATMSMSGPSTSPLAGGSFSLPTLQSQLPAIPLQPIPVSSVPFVPPPPPSSSERSSEINNLEQPLRGDIQFSHVVPNGGDSSPYLPRAEAGPSTGTSGRVYIPNPLERQLRAECPDPVQAGVIKESEVVELFQTYFDRLNTTVPVLDPFFHTAEYCRTRSPLLFTAILTVTSKVTRPRVYSPCLMLANKLLGQTMQYDLCTVEIIQAINILTHWKKADDPMSWRRVGLAIRMAQELKLDVRTPRPLPTGEMDAREALNQERAWLNLIIADYHLAIHHSLPRMITEERLDDIEEWLKEHAHFPCPGENILPPMIAWSRMCRLYKDMLSAMSEDPSNLRLLQWVEAEWKRWRRRWIEIEGATFLPQQLATFKHCDAYFRFHVAEYRLLYVSRYRSTGQMLDISQASPLSIAFGDCVDAAMGLSSIFQSELVSQGLLPYCFNLVWVSLANIVAMSASDRSRVIKSLTDAQSATEEASRSSDDMCGYITRLLKHLLAGVNPEWQLASLIGRPQDELYPPMSIPANGNGAVNTSDSSAATATSAFAAPWEPASIQQVIRDQLWPQPLDPPHAQHSQQQQHQPTVGVQLGNVGGAGLQNTLANIPVQVDDMLFPSDDDEFWRVLFPATDSMHTPLL